MTGDLGPLEVVVGLAVVVTAAIVLWAPRLAAAVSFLVFGVLLAALWAVLGAPDIAVAEAALGTGITGALFIEAITRAEADPATARREPRWPAVVAALALGLVVVPLVVGVASGPGTGGLAGPVADAVPASGVTHPITAVLLAFRAYDTLLEIAVLFLAVVVVGALRPTAPVTEVRSVLLRPLVVWLLPLLLLVAGWILFAGSSLPGGAFQAGAVLGAALVAVRITGVAAVDLRWWDAGAALGPLAFIGLAAAGLAFGGWLVLPTGAAGVLIVALEAVLTVAIAVSLALLVAAVGEAVGTDAEVAT